MPRHLTDEDEDPLVSSDDDHDIWQEALDGSYVSAPEFPVDDPIHVNLFRPPAHGGQTPRRALVQRDAPYKRRESVKSLRKELFENWKSSEANIDECLDFIAENRGTLSDYCVKHGLNVRAVHVFFASDAQRASRLREAVELGAMQLVNNSLRMIAKTPARGSMLQKSGMLAAQILKVAKTRVTGFADDAARIGLAIHSAAQQPPVINVAFDPALLTDAQRSALSAPPDFASHPNDDRDTIARASNPPHEQ